MQFLVEGNPVELGSLKDFLKRLVTPFEKTDAYKFGIIDKFGNILKSRKDLKTSKEKSANFKQFRSSCNEQYDNLSN